MNGYQIGDIVFVHEKPTLALDYDTFVLLGHNHNTIPLEWINHFQNPYMGSIILREAFYDI